MTSGYEPAKEQAANEAATMKETVKSEAADLGTTAKDEARNVATEAKYQAKGMLDESVSQLRTQASTGQNRLADVVRDLAKEAGQMSQASDANGVVTRLAEDASRMGDDVAQWLEHREPEDVLDEVRRFAARRPATFLAIAAGAGFLAGRFIKGMQSDAGQPAQLSSGRYQQPRALQGGHYGEQHGQVSEAPAAGRPQGDHLYSYSDDAHRLGQPGQQGEQF